MGDLYSELLVKKDKTAKDSLLKYGLIVLTVLAVFAGLIITPLALIIAVALGIACYFVIPKTDVEYEYLFINGDFDIDMIMSKTKRKKELQIIRGRSGCNAGFPQNGLLQRKPEHESTGFFIRKSGA